MKRNLHIKQLINGLLLIVTVLLSNFNLQAQTGVTVDTRLNFSNNPVLISGTNNKAGAKYKYANVAAGLDAIVSIDSIVGGATINTIDDNTGKNGGYVEGLQPQITSGPAVGYSYAVFTISLKTAGTNLDQTLDNVTLTALDIDGTSTLKEFDQISLGTGATAWYMGSNPTIALTGVGGGTFMGINADGVTRNGVDTSAKSNMFTITNTNISSFTAKLGILNDHSTKTLRLFSIYMKGFDYPDMLVMPVTLQSFTTTLNNNNEVNVKWTTATQNNVSHFVVQRSVDGKNFSEAGLVFSDGNSNNAINYSLTDKVTSLKANVIYYRLCTVDLDGKLQYSDTRMVRISGTSADQISVLTYPNPVANELRVTIPTSWQAKRVSYELYNVNGQLSKRVEEGSSTQTETINVSKLTTGMYIVKVICEGRSSIQKIVKY